MRKKLLPAVIIILALVAVVIFFIPPVKSGNYQAMVTCNSDATMRIIINEKNWSDWWPGEKKSDSLYTYKNIVYRIDKILLNGFNATLFNGKDSAKADLQVAKTAMDSSTFIWSYVTVLSSNPFKKLVNYVSGDVFTDNIKSLTAALKNHFDKEENVYGMKITRETVKDSTLVSLKKQFDHYPTTEEVYRLIAEVKEYIKKKGGEESDYPMLNIHTEIPGSYDAMVGIPTKVPLPAEGDFLTKRLVLGFILTGEVTGGISRVRDAEEQMNRYMLDHQKLAPAIPFQSLITNRQEVKDSTKWVTRLYLPVFF